MRKILHIDMDAFFAAVEQHDNPSLRGKPVIVGGDPGKRGVVSTCSYEARKFGVHSAMPSSTARRLCPEGIFVHGNFSRYREISDQIRGIFYDYTDLVEPLSLDEAYLDVTQECGTGIFATGIAQKIRERIRTETGLTASAGVSYNKFLAKIASDWRKPDGLTVIRPDSAQAFISDLPIRKFYGVGPAVEKVMHRLGIFTGKDILRFSRDELAAVIGKTGGYFYDIARGIDERPVITSRARKSLGREETFPRDLTDLYEIDVMLRTLADDVACRFERSGEKSARTVTIKVRYDDFTTISRSISGLPIKESEEIYRQSRELLAQTEAGVRPVRLLGITLTGFDSSEESREADSQLHFPFETDC